MSACQSWQAIAGGMIRNSVNSPGCVSTSIEPASCLTTMSWLMEKAEACAFSRRFCPEKRIENFPPYLRRNAGAVVANADLHTVPKALCRSSQRRLKAELLARNLRFVAA